MVIRLVAACVIVVMAAAVAWRCPLVTGLDTRFLESTCNANSHDANSDAEKACDEVSEYIRQHTADHRFSVQDHLQIGDDTYYGHGACTTIINQDDCTRCIGAAHDWAVDQCAFRNGVRIKLVDCRFRIENYPFSPKW